MSVSSSKSSTISWDSTQELRRFYNIESERGRCDELGYYLNAKQYGYLFAAPLIVIAIAGAVGIIVMGILPSNRPPFVNGALGGILGVVDLTFLGGGIYIARETYHTRKEIAEDQKTEGHPLLVRLMKNEPRPEDPNELQAALNKQREEGEFVRKLLEEVSS